MKTGNAKVGFRIGPGMPSLLMMLVTLLMAALAILAMAGAQADATLSQRNLETTLSYYQAAAQMQRELAEVDRLLLDARTAAADDTEAYKNSIRGLRSDYLSEVAEDGEGLLMLVAVPMRDDSYLEAQLRVPFGLTGARYTLLSHKLTDDMPWETEQQLTVFAFEQEELVLLEDLDAVEVIDAD